MKNRSFTPYDTRKIRVRGRILRGLWRTRFLAPISEIESLRPILHFPKPLFAATPIRKNPVKKTIKSTTVVRMDKMAKFVDHYVVDAVCRRQHQPAVERDATARRAAPPSLLHNPHDKFRVVDTVAPHLGYALLEAVSEMMLGFLGVPPIQEPMRMRRIVQSRGVDLEVPSDQLHSLIVPWPHRVNLEAILAAQVAMRFAGDVLLLGKGTNEGFKMSLLLCDPPCPPMNPFAYFVSINLKRRPYLDPSVGMDTDAERSPVGGHDAEADRAGAVGDLVLVGRFHRSEWLLAIRITSLRILSSL